jgi:hypothetical protein
VYPRLKAKFNPLQTATPLPELTARRSRKTLGIVFAAEVSTAEHSSSLPSSINKQGN